MSGFSEWVKHQLELRQKIDVADAARALGIRPSELGRWLSAKRPPTQDTIRTACRVFDVHVQEILVAAGYMTPEESGLDDKPISLSALSTKELADELARRSVSNTLSNQ
ncbi:helix-turn-helix domain-containing protein [Rhodococcus erythropolis]|uniref:helix-turn-helix domain-containing protein n=1 Tax=Rhodococcus erythropolis TaxID=1833 RepID=UPI0020350C46|nr:helix-turn-helix transcriptional regulator [Rhodococcus erythropolis]